jgi:putative ABC transport system ATP-binding protein
MTMPASSSTVDSSLIRATNVVKKFSNGLGSATIVDDVTLNIESNELVLLMGPSGSGKTTLISLLAGLLRPTSGSVEVCGTRLQGSDAEIAAVRRRSMSFIFQNYHLFAGLSARDNIAELLCLRGARRAEARREALGALDAVGLAPWAHHKPNQLSGGQRQRVAIARAFAMKPRLILGDEVTAALDTEAALQVMELLRSHLRPGTAILLVTHDQRLTRFAQRVIELEDGRLKQGPALAAVGASQ